MPNSQHYIDLENRIEELKRNLMPTKEKMRLSVNFTRRQTDMFCGFRLLVHAEIEYFLETVATECLKENLRAWRRKSSVTDSLLCLTAFFSTGLKSIEDPKIAQTEPDLDLVVRLVTKSFTTYFSTVENNHGIKEDNIRAIMLPLGIRCSELDQTWLSSMSSYGALRGDVAHKSAKVQQPIDPASEIATVQILLQGLEELDRLVNSRYPIVVP